MRRFESALARMTGAAFCVYTGYRLLTSKWLADRVEDYRQRIIAEKKQVLRDAAMIRTQIQREMELVRISVRKGHSHQEAATERNSATETMLGVVEKCGYEPYVISPSPREVGYHGSRQFYSLADFRQDYRRDDITDRHIIVMTDVDYYVDMHELIGLGVPVLLYTFQPSTVSGEVKDGYFTITDDSVHYRVAGGKDVRHRIWNYNQDTMYVRSRPRGFWANLMQILRDVTGVTAICGFLYAKLGIAPFGDPVTIFTVDQFKMGEHRNIVSIVPFATCRSNLLKISEYGAELEYMRYQQRNNIANFNAVTYISENGPLISLGLEGNFASVQLPLQDFENIRTAYELSKTNNLSDTVRRSGRPCKEAAIIHKCLQAECAVVSEVVHKPGDLARHYQAVGNAYDTDPAEQGKCYAREYAPGPLTQTAVFPSESRSNELATIDGRIAGPQAKAKSREHITPRMRRMAREFVHHLVPIAGTGRPYPLTYVEEQQTKPLQRARNDANRYHDEFTMMVKAFQKKEAYNAPNYPRNISTVPHTQNVKLSSYTYAFKASVLQHVPWYMPTHTPAEIADAVQNLAASSTELVETDYSKFDGTFLRFMRECVEFAIYKRWVHLDHLPELTTLLANEIQAPAVTRLGIKYDPDCSRLSGSALTTDGNSIANAFVSYLAGRMAGMGDDEAWSWIGIVYGDDGLRSGNVSNELLTNTASSLGFDLKIVNRAPRGSPVTFLSRVYLDPWSSPASVQSPLRTLLKLHTTCDTQSEIDNIGWAKTQAYLVTDSKTPFIGHWCRAYQRNCTARVVQYADYIDIPFWVKNDDHVSNSWPQSESDDWNDVVANELGVTTAELLKHLELLDAYTGPVSGLPRLTTSIDLEPKMSVALDGEIQAGPSQNKTSKDGTNPTSDRSAPRRARAALPGDDGHARRSRRSDRDPGKRDAHVRDKRPRRSSPPTRPVTPVPARSSGGRGTDGDGLGRAGVRQRQRRRTQV
ncbi:protein A [Pseudodiaptomus annandalei nervous necrosis virus]|nr:protein A [Pseudodiaptomus annandalei nervous necrosis virus]